MKKLLLLIILAFTLSTSVFAETDKDNILTKYEIHYGKAFDEGLSEFDNIPKFNSSEVLRELNSGELSLSPKDILSALLNLLFKELMSSAKILAIVLALVVLSSYLSGLKTGFGESGVSNVAFYTCYVVIAGVASSAFYDTSLCAIDAVKNIAFFMRIIVPVIITSLLTSGAIISAAALEPTLLAITEIVVWIIETVFIPAIMISASLSIVGGISDKFKTDRIVKLLGNTVKYGLTLTLTIFVSLAGLKSIAASGVDGLTIKISKFATTNLIPMVGGILSESVETIMSCSVVIKNSVGILGVICVLLIAIHPVLKIASILILFRITAAIAEPISEPKIIVCLSRLSDSISVIFSMLSAVTVMFIMVLTIMINAGSTAIFLGR